MSPDCLSIKFLGYAWIQTHLLFFFGDDNLTGDLFSVPKPPDLFIGQGQVSQWVQSILEGNVDGDNRAFVSELALVTVDNYLAPVTSLRIIYTAMKLGYNEQKYFSYPIGNCQPQ